MKHILVTGGAGYLGSTMVPELLNAGYKVTVIDNFMFKQTSLNHVCHHPNFEVIKGDIRVESRPGEGSKFIFTVPHSLPFPS